MCTANDSVVCIDPYNTINCCCISTNSDANIPIISVPTQLARAISETNVTYISSGMTKSIYVNDSFEISTTFIWNEDNPSTLNNIRSIFIPENSSYPYSTLRILFDSNGNNKGSNNKLTLVFKWNWSRTL
jgi:hypothetical protein